MKAGGRASLKLRALRGPGAGRLFPVLVHGGRTKELLENFLGGSYINVFLPSVHYSPPGRRPRRGGGAGPLGPGPCTRTRSPAPPRRPWPTLRPGSAAAAGQKRSLLITRGRHSGRWSRSSEDATLPPPPPPARPSSALPRCQPRLAVPSGTAEGREGGRTGGCGRFSARPSSSPPRGPSSPGAAATRARTALGPRPP